MDYSYHKRVGWCTEQRILWGWLHLASSQPTARLEKREEDSNPNIQILGTIRMGVNELFIRHVPKLIKLFKSIRHPLALWLLSSRHLDTPLCVVCWWQIIYQGNLKYSVTESLFQNKSHTNTISSLTTLMEYRMTVIFCFCPVSVT